jgi:hypothetical protein
VLRRAVDPGENGAEIAERFALAEYEFVTAIVNRPPSQPTRFPLIEGQKNAVTIDSTAELHAKSC